MVGWADLVVRQFRDIVGNLSDVHGTKLEGADEIAARGVGCFGLATRARLV